MENPIFNVLDIVLEIINFLDYKDILALRCCKKLAFYYLPLQSLYKAKTDYLKSYGLDPKLIAKACKDRKYLAFLTKEKIKIDRDKLFADLEKCDNLILVSSIMTSWNPKMGRKNQEAIQSICCRFFAEPPTQRRLALLTTYCKDAAIEPCIKYDNLEYWKLLGFKTRPFRSFLGDHGFYYLQLYKALRILNYVLKDTPIIKEEKCLVTSDEEKALELCGYKKSYDDRWALFSK